MARLALFTFGVLSHPAEHPATRAFLAADAEVWPALEAAPGLLGHSGYPGEPGPPSWGRFVIPRFFDGPSDSITPQTLSLWRDLTSAADFAYRGRHGEALGHAREWFQTPRWPTHVLWWVGDRERPDWASGCARLERLHDRGPGPEAFDFRHRHGPDGTALAKI